MESKNLYDYLKIPADVESKNKVIDCLDCLKKEYKEFILTTFNSDFTAIVKPYDQRSAHKFRYCIVPKLSSIIAIVLPFPYGSDQYQEALKKAKIDSATSNLNLMHCYDDMYTFEELIYAIGTMRKQEITAFINKYGPSLDGNGSIFDEMSDEEKFKLNTQYRPKLKKILAKLYPNRKPVSVRTKHPKVLEPVAKPTKVVTETPSTPGVSVPETSSEDKCFLEIVKLFNSPEFKEITRLNFSLEEITVASLLHYGYKGKRFNINTLAEFLGITTKEVTDIAISTTEKYRSVINQKIDEYEFKLTKVLPSTEKDD